MKVTIFLPWSYLIRALYVKVLALFGNASTLTYGVATYLLCFVVPQVLCNKSNGWEKANKATCKMFFTSYLAQNQADRQNGYAKTDSYVMCQPLNHIGVQPQLQ